MGYTTDFSGSFELNKPLSEKMKEFLINFAGTRRMGRKLDEKYGVDGEFFCEDLDNCGQNSSPNVIDHNKPPSTQPGLWCQWIPNGDGTAIKWDGGEKFYDYTEWLVYLIHKILKPNGYVLDGQVTWDGEETGDVGEIFVKKNKVFIKPWKGKRTEIKIEDVSKTDYGKNFKRIETKNYMRPDVVLLIDNAKPGKKQTFAVEVVRTSYAFKTIEVEATSQEEAEKLALDEAGDHLYSEKDADYKLAKDI